LNKAGKVFFMCQPVYSEEEHPRTDSGLLPIHKDK